MTDAVEQHRLVCEGKLEIITKAETLEPFLRDVETKEWIPMSDEFSSIVAQVNDANKHRDRTRYDRQ